MSALLCPAGSPVLMMHNSMAAGILHLAFHIHADTAQAGSQQGSWVTADCAINWGQVVPALVHSCQLSSAWYCKRSSEGISSPECERAPVLPASKAFNISSLLISQHCRNPASLRWAIHSFIQNGAVMPTCQTSVLLPVGLPFE